MVTASPAYNFVVNPSPTQLQLDSLWWLLSLLLCVLLVENVWWCLALTLAAVLGVVGLYWHFQRQTAVVLYQQAGHWYLNQRQALPWRTGSVKRASVIIWQYGRWPWQRLYIRPDSLAAGQYRELLVALAS